MRPSVSVIVPIYNSEATICRCIDSLLSQTFSDWEAILVDDGSTDTSSMICDRYYEVDKRFVVLHQENSGVSSARERGLSNARGEYVIHLDADDWIEPEMLERLLDTARKECADMVICDFIDEWPDKSIINKQVPSVNENKVLIREMFTKLHGSCWNKLVKRDLFKRYDIHFPSNINIGEDLFVIVSLLLNEIKVSYLPEALYHYDHTSNPFSLTNSRRDWSIIYQSQVKCYEELFDDKYPDILEYLRYLAKRELFINGSTYSEFMSIYPEVNNRLTAMCKTYPGGRLLRFASRNRLAYKFIQSIRHIFIKLKK